MKSLKGSGLIGLGLLGAAAFFLLTNKDQRQEIASGLGFGDAGIGGSEPGFAGDKQAQSTFNVSFPSGSDAFSSNAPTQGPTGLSSPSVSPLSTAIGGGSSGVLYTQNLSPVSVPASFEPNFTTIGGSAIYVAPPDSTSSKKDATLNYTPAPAQLNYTPANFTPANSSPSVSAANTSSGSSGGGSSSKKESSTSRTTSSGATATKSSFSSNLSKIKRPAARKI